MANKRITPINPLGYNPNPVNAADTRVGEITNYQSPAQQQQAVAAVTKNNTKDMAHQAENDPTQNLTGLNRPMPQALRQPINIGFRTPASTTTQPGFQLNLGQTSPTATSDGRPDVYQIAEDLRQKQEAARKRYEQQRQQQAYSRLGFALGQLLGARSGSRASTITDQTASDVKRSYEDMIKENEDAYKRAVENINRQYDQDYKSQALSETIRHDAETERQNEEYRRGMLEINQQRADSYGTRVQQQNENDQTRLGIQQQNADTAQARAATGAQNAANTATRNEETARHNQQRLELERQKNKAALIAKLRSDGLSIEDATAQADSIYGTPTTSTTGDGRRPSPMNRVSSTRTGKKSTGVTRTNK